MELRGASLHFLKSFLTPTSPPLRPNGISLILVVIIKTKQEDSDDRIYETSAQSYVSKQGGCQGEFKLIFSRIPISLSNVTRRNLNYVNAVVAVDSYK